MSGPRSWGHPHPQQPAGRQEAEGVAESRHLTWWSRGQGSLALPESADLATIPGPLVIWAQSCGLGWNQAETPFTRRGQGRAQGI